MKDMDIDSELMAFFLKNHVALINECTGFFKEQARRYRAELADELGRPLTTVEDDIVFRWISAMFLGIGAFTLSREGCALDAVIEYTKDEFKRATDSKVNDDASINVWAERSKLFGMH
jgi:hypothetical protein